MDISIHVVAIMLSLIQLCRALLSYNCKAVVPKEFSLTDKDIAGARFRGENCLLLLLIYNRAGQDVHFLWDSCTKADLSVIYHHSKLDKTFVKKYTNNLTESLKYVSDDCINSFKELDISLAEFHYNPRKHTPAGIEKSKNKREIAVINGIYPSE